MIAKSVNYRTSHNVYYAIFLDWFRIEYFPNLSSSWAPIYQIDIPDQFIIWSGIDPIDSASENLNSQLLRQGRRRYFWSAEQNESWKENPCFMQGGWYPFIPLPASYLQVLIRENSEPESRMGSLLIPNSFPSFWCATLYLCSSFIRLKSSGFWIRSSAVSAKTSALSGIIAIPFLEADALTMSGDCPAILWSVMLKDGLIVGTT